MLAVVSVLCLIAGALLARKRFNYSKALLEYHTKLEAIPSAPDHAYLDALKVVQGTWKFTEAHTREFCDNAYKSTFVRSISEAAGESAAFDWLEDIAKALGINPNRKAEVDVEGFQELVWLLLVDHKLTSEEEALIQGVQGHLKIPEDRIREESDAIEQFRRTRSLEEEGPSLIPTEINLQRGELCHHRTRGSLLEKKLLRSYTVKGGRVREEGLVPVREGDVYVTSKRILVLGDGTSAIPHQKVLEVEADFDKKLITITKDGKSKPLYLSVPDPIYTARLIEYLSSGG